MVVFFSASFVQPRLKLSSSQAGENILVLRSSLKTLPTYLEHFARPLTIAGGDDGGVNVHKTIIMEVPVRSSRQIATDTRDSTDEICPRSKMHHGAQEFRSHPGFRDGIGLRVTRSNMSDPSCTEFHRLFRPFRRAFHLPFDHQTGSSGRDIGQGPQLAFHDDLQVAGTRSVVQFDECERSLALHASCLDPSADADRPSVAQLFSHGQSSCHGHPTRTWRFCFDRRHRCRRTFLFVVRELSSIHPRSSQTAERQGSSAHMVTRCSKGRQKIG